MRRAAEPTLEKIIRDDEKWLKHTLTWVNSSDDPVIAYRPVTLATGSTEADSVPPTDRVY